MPVVSREPVWSEYRRPWGYERRVEADELLGRTRTATGLDCGTTYHFRVSARGDGSPYSTSFGSASASVSGATSACPSAAVEITLEPESPFVGQAVRMAASTTVASGQAPSYQWQEWSSGNWVNLGTASASKQRSVSSSASGLRIFRVVVAYAGGATSESSPATIQWRPMSVSVSASPAYPRAGAEATSTVTLTAEADAPSDAVYRWQEVTFRATPAAASGPAVLHWWQEWSGGGWVDLGSATTWDVRRVTSSVSGFRTFRVKVAYLSRIKAESEPLTVEWRPVVVGVTSSPAYPRAGAPATSTVTLTAGGDVPSGAEFQWQEWRGNRWANLGAASASPTKDVSSAVRGTKKYRVVVSHATASTAVSEAVYVTWDEWAIVADMIRELSAAVATSTDYKEKQTALLSCMNGPGGATSTTSTYASFDDILARYATTTKAKMEGTCSTQADTMFKAVQRQSRIQLNNLTSGTFTAALLYSGLLETPHGKQFKASVGEPHITKLFIYLLAYEPPEPATGFEGASDTPTTVQRAGFDCLPWSGREPSSVENKIAVVNCLVFDTPHSFWVDNAAELHNRIDRSYQRRDGVLVGRLDWLGYGDWECTLWADGPLPTCYKHDVALSSLQKFAGVSSSTEEMDEAWNPRNKHLADAKAMADIEKYDCQNPTLIAIIFPFACVLPAGTGPLTTAGVMHFGMNKLNSPWPVTVQDIEHAESNPQYIRCTQPAVTSLDEVSHVKESRFRVVWTISRSCTGTSVQHSIRVVGYTGASPYDRNSLTINDSGAVEDDDTTNTLSFEFEVQGVDALDSGTPVRLEITIAMHPRDVDYGQLLDPVLPGVYTYPVAVFSREFEIGN